MNLNRYLKLVANRFLEWNNLLQEFGIVYRSKYDGSYLVAEWCKENVRILAKLEITDCLQHGLGYSPKEGKWFGWTHRGIYGFKIGSTCKRGDCHYKPSTHEESAAAGIEFWSDSTFRENVRAELRDDGIWITWDGSSTNGVKWDVPFGRGEWTAWSMDDARQMAIDYRDGIS